MTEKSHVSDNREAATPPLRRNRGFQMLWSSSMVTGLANEVAELAYPLVILALTGSVAYAGILGSAQLAVLAVMTLPAGVIADRFDRRTVMIIANVMRGITFTCLAVTILSGVATVPIIVAAAMISAVFGSLNGPSATAAIKQLVPVSQMTTARAQMEARTSSISLVGSPLGGVLFAVGRSIPFVFSALAFFLGAVAVALIRTPLNAKPRGEKPGIRGAFAGIGHLLAKPYLARMVSFAMVINIMLAGFPLALLALLDRRGADASLIGVLMAIVGVFGLLGAMASPKILTLIRPPALFIGTAFVVPALAVGTVLVPGMYLPAVVASFMVFALIPFNALYMTYVMNSAPDHLQGRVAAGVQFFALVLQPLGPLTVGVVFEWKGPLWAFGLIAGFTALAGVFMLSRHIRSIPSPEAVAE